jgi:hypothetical protein
MHNFLCLCCLSYFFIFVLKAFSNNNFFVKLLASTFFVHLKFTFCKKVVLENDDVYFLLVWGDGVDAWEPLEVWFYVRVR